MRGYEALCASCGRLSNREMAASQRYKGVNASFWRCLPRNPHEYWVFRHRGWRCPGQVLLPRTLYAVGRLDSATAESCRRYADGTFPEPASQISARRKIGTYFQIIRDKMSAPLVFSPGLGSICFPPIFWSIEQNETEDPGSCIVGFGIDSLWEKGGGRPCSNSSSSSSTGPG